jgi:hypothetical protein
MAGWWGGGDSRARRLETRWVYLCLCRYYVPENRYMTEGWRGTGQTGAPPKPKPPARGADGGRAGRCWERFV